MIPSKKKITHSKGVLAKTENQDSPVPPNLCDSALVDFIVLALKLSFHKYNFKFYRYRYK